MPARQYCTNTHSANANGITTEAVAAMFIPGMMPHRLKMNTVMKMVVIIGT